MAQAARLNLRMQKELKLLITDPPTGASFPSLSDDSSASSLTSIDAHFQGPEGTVYADGVFKIKIQIPERYPFQPPMVTFATPIYHPNIDNGGRICLDILNLPPKGSWQPSLNISTVLISIGLLLSEPNPDDGLMHDASREYKYNRQAFDQKARSMTDKYARAGESGSSIGSQDSQTHMSPRSKAESKGSDASKCVIGSNRKLSLESLGSKSKLDSSSEISNLPNHNYSKSNTKSGQHEEAKAIPTEFNRNPDKQQATKLKLSLKVPIVSHSGNCESTRTSMSNHCSSVLATQNPSMDSPDSLPFVLAGRNHAQVSYKGEDFSGRNCISVNQETQSLESVKKNQGSWISEKLQPALSTTSNEVITNHMETKSHKDAYVESESGSRSTDIRLKTGVTIELRKYLKPIGRPVLLHDEKENLAPNKLSRTNISKRELVSENGHNERMDKKALSVAQKLSGVNAKLPLELVNEFTGSKSNHLKSHLENPPNCRSKVLNARNDDQLDKKLQIHEVHGEESTGEFKQQSAGSPEPEATIVLDSEDSEDEIVPVRSKLLLARKCLALKRKYIT